MKEKLVYWPFSFTGTTAASSGTFCIAVPCGMSFRWGAVHVPMDAVGTIGGTVTVTSAATGQGTVILPINAAAGGGSAWTGTAAFAASTGTILATQWIPAGGTIIVVGSAGLSATEGGATQLSGVLAYAAAEA